MTLQQRRKLVFGVLTAFALLFSAATPARSTDLACRQIGDKWGCASLPTRSTDVACGQIGDKWGCRVAPSI